jgi:protein-disulfide isomerase
LTRMFVALALGPLLLAGCNESGGATKSADAPAGNIAAPAGQSWSEVVSRTPEGGYRMGNPNAPVKLVEYGARTCPTCGRFGVEGTPPLVQNHVNTGRVSFEFRDYLVHGAPDLAAALVGTCGGEGPFFPMLEQMFGMQEGYLNKLQSIPPEVQARLQGATPQQTLVTLAEQMDLISFAQQRGVPEQQVRQCLADQGRIDAIVKVTEDATKAGTVTGTPTFLINGENAEVTTWADLEPKLKAAGG